MWIILGQLWSKHLRKQEKRYGCLFTCLVTRAVHLEVAKSLETDSFINALRRFIARRGPPSDIYSDNGTNFRRSRSRAQAESRRVEPVPDLRLPVSEGYSVALQSSCFPSLWWDLGTFGSVMQESLKVVLHGQVVTDEVLETAFAETEALVNSRPLTEVSSDSGLEAITPNHFLISRANPVLPCGVFSDVRKYQARNVGDKHKLLLIKFGADG